MITFRSSQLAGINGVKVTCEVDGTPLPYSEALRLWRDDPGFRAQFNATLADMPYSAFRWELPPITLSTAGRVLEFVVLDSPGLSRPPDQHAFAEHFTRAPNSLVVEFSNIGKDAVMVVPCPRAAAKAYGHLAAFVRHAPEQQQSALWAAVGSAMSRRLGPKPVWLSTAGAGVSWLHVRLDDKPKYYGYAAFQSTAQQGAAADDRPQAGDRG